MGRKSKAKKVVREYIKEKKDDNLSNKIKKDKKARKELKKEILKIAEKENKLPKKSKVKNKVNKKRREIFKSGFVLIMVALVFAVGFLLFQKAFRPTPIAKYLPLENTVLTVEINSNLNHQQLPKGLNLLKNHPEYSQKNLTQKIEEKFKVSFEKEMKNWIGRQLGFALIDFGTKEESDAQTIYFAEVLSNKNLNDTLLSKAESVQYKKHTLYTFDDDKAATVIGDYLFMSEKKPVLRKIIDFTVSPSKRLSKDNGYIKIKNNTPVNRSVFFFINYNRITQDIVNKSELLSKMQSIKPITDLFKSEGLALIALDDKFAVQSFLNLNNDGVKNKKFISFREKYEANLLDYVSKDAITFWGGKNLDYQLKRMIEVFAGGEKSSIAIFDNVLQNYTQKYFGQETNLRKDILPIFNNEFVLALENIEGKNVYKLIIELQNLEKDAENVHSIAENFANAGAVYQEKTVQHTLPDGTKSSEVIAVPIETIREEMEVDGAKVYALKIGRNRQGIFYTFMGGRAVIADDLLGIKESIKLSRKEVESFAASPNYTKLISPLLSNSDEVTYFNIEKLLPLVLKKSDMPNLLGPVKALSSGKNYFADGITTINYLHIE